jgi:hypothetical protein
LLCLIPEGKGEIADNVLEAVGFPDPISGKNQPGIGVIERLAVVGTKRLKDFLSIIDPPIKVETEAAVRRAEGLPFMNRLWSSPELGVRKSHGAGVPVAGTIWPTHGERLAHAMKGRHIGRAAIQVQDSGYSRHESGFRKCPDYVIGLKADVTEEHAIVCFKPCVRAKDIGEGIADADLDFRGDVTAREHDPASQRLREASSAKGRRQGAADALDYLIHRSR